MKLYWFFLILLVSNSFQETIYECIGRDEKVLALDRCQDGEVVHLEDVLYGKYAYCVFVSGECKELRPGAFPQCKCAQNCSVPVKHFYSLDCRDFVNFVRIVYTCLNAEAADECKTTTQTTMQSTTTHLPIIVSSPVMSREDKALRDRWRERSLTSRPTSTGSTDTKDMLIIVGCASASAVLVMAIITVVLVLRRFSWCLRRPPNRDPDGSENPDDVKTTHGSQSRPSSVLMKPNSGNGGATTPATELNQTTPTSSAHSSLSRNSIDRFCLTVLAETSSVISGFTVDSEPVDIGGSDANTPDVHYKVREDIPQEMEGSATVDLSAKEAATLE